MVHPAREEGSEISVAPISKATASGDFVAGLKRQSEGTSSSTTSRNLNEPVHPAQTDRNTPAFAGKQTLVESRSDWQPEVGDGPAEESLRNVVEETSDIPAILKKVKKPGFVSKLPPWQDALAGATAGLGSTLLLHPLDVIKTRLQVQDAAGLQLPKYRGTFHAFRSILKNEGGRALYGGLGPAILGSSISWGIYFSYYSGAKRRYQRWTGRKELSAPLHLLAAGEAGAVCAICTNPIWVLKTRLQIQEKLRVAASQQLTKPLLVPYRGTYDAFRSILREEGIQGFYRGLAPSLLLVSHGALQFMAYEEMRKLAVKVRGVNSQGIPSGGSGSGERELKAVDFASIGAASKLFATIVTYPTQVIRSRLQQRPGEAGYKYRNGWNALRELVKNEGGRGLYKGFVPNVLRVMPSSAITFVLYESLMRILKKPQKDS